MNKIVVIGSKGFIGTHLKEFFEEKGEEVWGADVVVDYAETERYFLIDASNSDYKSIFNNNDFSLCVNCSGAASVPDSLENPLRDYHLNSGNVFKMLNAIRSHSPECRFINLSSAAVYGNPESLPVHEGMKYNPMSPYGFHKMMSENICEEFHRFFDLKTCSLRIFSAFGEGLKKQLFWDLYKKAKSGEKVSLFGSGKESRDFIYIGDLVRAIAVVAENTDFSGEAINVANGEEVLIEDCVRTFYDQFDKDVDFAFSGEARKGDPDNWVADIEALKKLGYKQQYSMEDGLKNYYKWIRTID